MSTPVASSARCSTTYSLRSSRNFIGVPLGRVQQALHSLRVPLADGLGHLPAVLALDPPEQPDEVAFDSFPGLRAGEAGG